MPSKRLIKIYTYAANLLKQASCCRSHKHIFEFQRTMQLIDGLDGNNALHLTLFKGSCDAVLFPFMGTKIPIKLNA
jgi:hypothetical protein